MCKSIVSGQATSLDITSGGLLSVMQELSQKSSRREAGKSLTATAETDWAKKITNFAPYGQWFLCSALDLFFHVRGKGFMMTTVHNFSSSWLPNLV